MSEASLSARNFSSEHRTPLFSRGFNDRILFRRGQLKTWVAYLDMNAYAADLATVTLE